MNFNLTIFLFFLSFYQYANAQQIKPDKLPQQWQFCDLEKDSVYGISAFKTKQTFLKSKKPLKYIIVAVIDGGVETNHKYLGNYIWTNKREIPNNNLDDDKNGYVDDVNGWNFVGNTKSSCNEDIRDYIVLKPKFDKLKDSLEIKKHPSFERWKFVVQKKASYYNEIADTDNFFHEVINDYRQLINYYKDKLNIESVNFKTLKDNPITENQDSLLYINYQKRIKFLSVNADVLTLNLENKIKEFEDIIKELNDEKNYTDTLIANSNPYYYFHQEKIYPEKMDQKQYGNNNVASKQDHGTACAGFIADYNYLTESNTILIMPIKIFVSGLQEQNDKDLYNAIHYAVDNGAKVISMSFSNSTCLNRKLIDKAFIYAQKKGVIIVQSAGNLSINIDNPIRFPSAELANGKRADNVIRVGASSYSSKNLACDFSNYGQKQVDLFAPGEYLHYATLNNKSQEMGYGTSFSTPITAGLVATLWSYYPQFTYKQIIDFIEMPIKKIDIETTQTNTNKMVRFSSLSKTGGIVNMYEAFKYAEKFAGNK